jgi:hypothetical protein
MAAPRVITLKVEIDIDNGQVRSVTADNAAGPTNVTQTDLAEKFAATDGMRHLGNVLWSHSSPGCVYWIGGIQVNFC